MSIQLMTLNGRIVEAARWKASRRTGIYAGQSMFLNVQISAHPKLVALLKSQRDQFCALDEDETISCECTVQEMNLLFDTATEEFQSMVSIVPINRNTENVLLYVYEKTWCDPRFLAQVESR